MAVSDVIPGVAVLKWIAAALAGAVAASALLVLFYEGVPLGPVRDIPLLGPAIASVVDGRVDRQRAAGASGERLLWEEARRKLIARQREQRIEAQAAVDDAERRYLDAIAARDRAEADLQSALDQSEKDDAANPDARRGPAITRGVSRTLDQVGR